jgi:hypothetical protein
MLTEPAVLVIHIQVYAKPFGGKFTCLGGSRPVAIPVGLVGLVYVVCIAEDAQSGVIGETEIEGASQSAHSRRSVAYP